MIAALGRGSEPGPTAVSVGSFVFRTAHDKLLRRGPHGLVRSALFIFVPPHDIVLVMYQPMLFGERYAHDHHAARPV